MSFLDFYHTCERPQKLAEALGELNPKTRVSRRKKLLLRDRIDEVIAQAQELLTPGSPSPDLARENVAFLQRH